MILENKWSWKRFGILSFMIAATAAMSVAVIMHKETLKGEWMLLGLCGIIFSVFLALSLEWERNTQGVFHEKSNNFVRIGVTYGVCCLLTVGMSFLPEYARPVMIPAVLMSMVSTPFNGVLTGGYISILLTISADGSLSLLACYLMLVLCGCILMQYIQDKKNLFWCNFMILCVTFCISALCSMLGTQSFSVEVLIYGIASGVVSALAVTLIFRIWNDRIVYSKEDFLEKIIREEYSLSKTMQSYSKVDYEHARKVSRIAAECARAIGADERLSAAAGFYYRVGRLEGEPFVENGIELAKKHDFPPELIRILGEYNGEKYLPSTVESALVHIVDHVVTKFDVLDRTTLSSSWNQDIVIYQTLNEDSAKGLYDKSGLGMNMFLIIRDYLIKEAGLYDNNFRK